MEHSLLVQGLWAKGGLRFPSLPSGHLQRGPRKAGSSTQLCLWRRLTKQLPVEAEIRPHSPDCCISLLLDANPLEQKQMEVRERGLAESATWAARLAESLGESQAECKEGTTGPAGGSCQSYAFVR